ncbi:MAG: HAD-IIA family hydrolase [Victivallaceae bacterium]|nr:HAD-IIA family hydrolase [Victivallaceae bacterium]
MKSETDIAERLGNVKLVCLDMDGTIYQGKTLFPVTIPFFDFLKEHAIKRMFLSNNSSFSLDEYVEKLGAMGIAATTGEFYTSTCFAVDYLHSRHPEIKRIYALAMPKVQKELEAAGFEIESDDPQAVIVAFDRSLCYERLCRAAYFMSIGVPALATHPDPFCPTDQKTFLPDCGSFIACLETATGKKIEVLGKPRREMLELAAARLGVTAAETMMIGDRLYTDVRLGLNAGAVAVQVTDFAECHAAEFKPDIETGNLGTLQKIWSKILDKAY